MPGCVVVRPGASVLGVGVVAGLNGVAQVGFRRMMVLVLFVFTRTLVGVGVLLFSGAWVSSLRSSPLLASVAEWSAIPFLFFRFRKLARYAVESHCCHHCYGLHSVSLLQLYFSSVHRCLPLGLERIERLELTDRNNLVCGVVLSPYLGSPRRTTGLASRANNKYDCIYYLLVLFI